jgi:nitrogen regulatory protein PII 1
MMVKIEAIVRPEKVNDVTAALQGIGCGGFHFVNVTGQGQQRGVEVFTGRGAALTHRSSLPKTVLVTVVPEEQKEEVLETIISSARSSEEGAVGDGKIFVSAVSEVARVRTRERDLDALTTSNGE